MRKIIFSFLIFMTGSLYGQLGNTPDTNCIDGKIYTNSLQVHYAGDGKINYKFYFKDKWGIKAIGEPTNNHTFTINNAPVLEYIGTGEYIDKGVNKTSGKSGDEFVFKIRYRDIDNQSPAVYQLWIDLNDDGNYDGSGEKIDMEEVDTNDTVYSNGKEYRKALKINYAGDGVLNYRFYFTDGIDVATGEATEERSISIEKPEGLGESLVADNLGDVIAGPIPFSLSEGGSFRFERLTANAVVKIYTILGELVRTLRESDGDGRLEWDLKNSAGVQVGVGVYICEITNEKGERKRGRGSF